MLKRLFIFGFIFAFLLSPVAKALSATSSVTGHKIVVDPGHGGTDKGSMECAGLYESQANLDIAQRLAALLAAEEAVVLLTRTDDSTLSNAGRYNQANEFGGEALVSIHLNGSTDHSKNGTMGLYGKRNKDLAFTEVLHNRLAAELDVPDLGVTNFASGVLLKSEMPASIQEAVFISNETECQLLTDGIGTRQQQIAQSLYNGLVDWFSQGSNGGNGRGGGPKCDSPPCK